MKIEEILKEDTEAQEKEFYGLGAWGNPYRANDYEYFVVGPYRTRAIAKKAVDRRHENGQPSHVRDWVSGNVKIFDSQEKLNAALKKLKLREINFEDSEADLENPMMWRKTPQ